MAPESEITAPDDHGSPPATCAGALRMPEGGETLAWSWRSESPGRGLGIRPGRQPARPGPALQISSLEICRVTHECLDLQGLARLLPGAPCVGVHRTQCLLCAFEVVRTPVAVTVPGGKSGSLSPPRVLFYCRGGATWGAEPGLGVTPSPQTRGMSRLSTADPVSCMCGPFRALSSPHQDCSRDHSTNHERLRR